MKSRTCVFVALSVSAIGPATGVAQLRFEEASVRTAERCAMQNSVDPGIVSLNGDPLKLILAEAFQLKADQINGPSWLDADCFTIHARMPEGANKDQMPAMLQALMIERFHVVTHAESRLRPGYALVVDQNGPRFRESDPNSPMPGVGWGQTRFTAAPAASGIKGSMTMAMLARFLSGHLGGPVQDLTGMAGKYDIDLLWTPDRNFEKMGPFAEAIAKQLTPAEEASLPSGTGDIFTSVRNSLGLRLDPRKEQVEFLVIDHIDRIPAEN